MNQELNNYITFSRESKMSDQDIKSNLLSKGWNIKDIEESFFILSGGDRSYLSYSIEEQSSAKRKNTFSIMSLVLFVVMLTLYILIIYILPIPKEIKGLSVLIDVLLSFVGLILGIIGFKSSRKIMASFGFCLNVLALVWFGFIFYLAFKS